MGRSDGNAEKDGSGENKGTSGNEGNKPNSLDSNRLVSIIENNIERNFGGIDYEIDIDLGLKLTDIENEIKLVEDIIKEFIPKPKNKKQKNKTNRPIKITSVFLFKKIYNFVCEETDNSFPIPLGNITKYDLNKCINDNINDVNNRYLLLEIKPSLSSLIHQNIRIQNPDKTTVFYEGSSFVEDNNNEYRFKIVNEIQEYAKTDQLMILQNLNQIQPFLYDLYNMNYIIKDEQKFARICLDNFSEQLTLVNDAFRIIILVDRQFVNEVDIAFLNRLEKMKITFDQLLDNEQKLLSKAINEEINFEHQIGNYENKDEKKNENKINYSLKDLLINCGKEEIEGLIYNFSIVYRNSNNKIDDTKRNEIKEKVYYKISNILPQDIICILQDNNIIKETYNDKKKYYNLKQYLDDKENKKYKISIIYTFNNIASYISGIKNEMKFMISEIKSENQLNTKINEIKNQNASINKEKNGSIVIHFEQLNSKKIQFVSNYIIKNFKDDEYNYIFIIHIKRNFDKIKDRIYSIPVINPDINQLFIDNLNA